MSSPLAAVLPRHHGIRPPRPVRGRLWIWLLALGFCAAYAAIGVRDQQEMSTTGYDLGFFEEVVRSYAHWHLPIVALKSPGFDQLGDHFSPILATLAPLYRLWPTPDTLLVAQAALFALAIVPLAGWAQGQLGRAAALIIGVGVGASWGIAQAAGFDFHEICFAVPLLAYSMTALGTGRFRAAVAWALPLLLVKEDLGLTVAVIGCLVASRGSRRLGAVTALAGLIGSVVEITVVIPALNPGGVYGFWPMLTGTGGSGVAVTHVLYDATVGMFTPIIKVATAALVLAPTAFQAVRSRLVWAAVPTLAWRFASTNPAYWGTDYHYSAVLMPIVFAAFVDVLVRQRDSVRTARLALIGSCLATVLLIPSCPLARLTQPALWHTSSRVAVARSVLSRIPDGATVAASDHLVPQLTDRAIVELFGLPESSAHAEWIVVDTELPDDWPLRDGMERTMLNQAATHGYRTVLDRDGYLLMTRRR